LGEFKQTTKKFHRNLTKPSAGLAFSHFETSKTYAVLMSVLLGSLAADQGLEDAIKKLDYLVNMLTPSQIEEGQRLAREWIATHTKAQATQ
jgi:hypothetical protein